ncbi:MAG: PTS IIA-like nitrogen regulatory protein PtsN [Chromatiales bacterium]|jgi:PTS system nitrogen regulatory IIA component
MFPSGFLTQDRVSIDVTLQSKKRLLEQLAELFSDIDPEISANDIFEKLLERERLGSTGLGKGVALPHARIENLKQAYAAFIRLQQPVDYDALDNQPVDLVFALLVPGEANEQHLQILASLAGFFNEANNCEQLRQATSSEQVIRLLSDNVLDAQSA